MGVAVGVGRSVSSTRDEAPGARGLRLSANRTKSGLETTEPKKSAAFSFACGECLTAADSRADSPDGVAQSRRDRCLRAVFGSSDHLARDAESLRGLCDAQTAKLAPVA
jgi:hypothetical protein